MPQVRMVDVADINPCRGVCITLTGCLIIMWSHW